MNLTAKNEILLYIEDKDEYAFDVNLSKKIWTVNLHIFKNGEETELSEEEKQKILPRISEYLKNIKWFGIFGGNYKVTFEKTEPFDFEEFIAHEESKGHKIIRNNDGSVTMIPPKRKSFLQWLFS